MHLLHQFCFVSISNHSQFMSVFLQFGYVLRRSTSVPRTSIRQNKSSLHNKVCNVLYLSFCSLCLLDRIVSYHKVENDDSIQYGYQNQHETKEQRVVTAWGIPPFPSCKKCCYGQRRPKDPEM